VLLTREGLLCAGGGRADLAVPVLERAEATGYAGADLQMAWGHTLMVQGKPDEALLRYRKAVALDPATRAEVPPELQPRL
jgi:Flp pilus assembly protein TadD